jgi:hypothetical protein
MPFPPKHIEALWETAEAYGTYPKNPEAPHCSLNGKYKFGVSVGLPYLKAMR